MTKRRKAILVVAVCVLAAASLAVWALRRPSYATVTLAELGPHETRSSNDGTAVWPEWGLDRRITWVGDRATRKAWTPEGDQVLIDDPSLDGSNFKQSKEPDSVSFHVEVGPMDGAPNWSLSRADDHLRYPYSRKLAIDRTASISYFTFDSEDSTDFAFRRPKSDDGSRIAYFSFYGSDEQNGVRYHGPGAGVRILSGFDPDVIPKTVEFDVPETLVGYYVWIVAEAAQGSLEGITRLPLSQPTLITAPLTKVSLPSQLLGQKLTGWHVFASPRLEFRLKDLAMKPRGAVKSLNP